MGWRDCAFPRSSPDFDSGNQATCGRSGNTAVLATPTVGYTCMWAQVYLTVGERPPPGCRDITPHLIQAQSWWKELDNDRRQLIQNNLGVRITFG